MAKITLSSLPAEIHVGIAKHCVTNDLYSLCLTSKLMYERFFRALYCYVDLQVDLNDEVIQVDSDDEVLQLDLDGEIFQLDLDDEIPQFDSDDEVVHSLRRMTRKKQQQFVHTLLSRPEYGKHVRFFRTSVYVPIFNDCRRGMISEEEYWRALRSLTHLQSVDLFSNRLPNGNCGNPPNDLFQSVTSVRLAGAMQYGLAKAIINSINPAMLKHLCLDLVEEYEPDAVGLRCRLGATPDLLTTLTGRCTALRTLILRMIGPYLGVYDGHPAFRDWDEAVEEAPYLESASFIRSVQGTVKEFTFEQVDQIIDFPGVAILRDHPFRVMDVTFLRLVLPTIVSSNWPCLTMMEIRGVRTLDGRDGKAALIMQLRAVLGADVKIVVEESTWPLPYLPTFISPL